MFLLEYSMPRARARLERERADARRPIAAVMQQRRDAETVAKVRDARTRQVFEKKKGCAR